MALLTPYKSFILGGSRGCLKETAGLQSNIKQSSTKSLSNKPSGEKTKQNKILEFPYTRKQIVVSDLSPKLTVPRAASPTAGLGLQFSCFSNGQLCVMVIRMKSSRHF